MSKESNYRGISDDALDQLFREAHANEGVEPLFVDQFWDEMQAMMPVAQKQKKRPVVLWWMSAAVAVFLLLFYVLNYKPANDFKQGQVAQNYRLEKDIAQETINRASFKQESNFNGVSSAETAPRINPDYKNHRVKNRFESFKNNLDNKTISHVDVLHDTITISDEPIVKDESHDAHLNQDLTFLQARALNDELKNLSNLKQVKLINSSFYMEAGYTLGQAPYTSDKGKRELISGCVLGGGYQLVNSKTYVQGGVQLRLEGFNGLSYVENNFSENIQRFVDVHQLYSLEFPLAFGYRTYHHQLGISFVPGIQCFLVGKERIVQNNQEVRNQNYTGPVSHSSSATLEMGFQYFYHFNSRWSLGAKMNLDLLRPFHTTYYLGQTNSFPINGQLVLRSTLFNKLISK